jgi:nucleoside-diphosphate-sugar epimerase
MRAHVSIGCDLARKELGYRPVVTIDEGLAGLSRSS